jgi:phosphoglycolate phosphatase
MPDLAVPHSVLPFRLLAFDWDGTLMDSVGSIVACTRAALTDINPDESWHSAEAEKRIRGTIGLGLRETIQELHPECDEALFERILERYRHHWIGTFRDEPPLFGGVVEMLADLGRQGYLLGVATGKSRRGLNYALEQARLGGAFHATRTADEAFSKPHPRMLLDLCEEVGVLPADTLMIGDTTFDLTMARSAGAVGLGVLSGSHTREELEACQPIACLNGVDEILAWLREPEASIGRAVRA